MLSIACMHAVVPLSWRHWPVTGRRRVGDALAKVVVVLVDGCIRITLKVCSLQPSKQPHIALAAKPSSIPCVPRSMG